ncbi:MAG: aminoacyl-tRNA hydrolase [Elusimicrobiota bacterium]
MKFIVGLGNPGKKYSSTRHNVGFAVLDNFAEDKSLKWREYKDRALVSVCDDFILVKPMLFMNLSGSAVESLVKKYLPRRQAGGTDFEDIIVVSDDMDISFGSIRIKKGGSSGGHNGVESIIETLGTNEFIRMRIGIGRPPSDTVAVDFVLSKFSQQEAIKMKSVIPRASEAVSVFIDSGLQKTMNLFNRRD